MIEAIYGYEANGLPNSSCSTFAVRAYAFGFPFSLMAFVRPASVTIIAMQKYPLFRVVTYVITTIFITRTPNFGCIKLKHWLFHLPILWLLECVYDIVHKLIFVLDVPLYDCFVYVAFLIYIPNKRRTYCVVTPFFF